MDSTAKLIDAIGHLLSSIAWPAAVIVIVTMLLRRHHDALDSLFRRTETAKFPGGLELAFSKFEEQADKVEQAATKVLDAAHEEDRESAVAELVREKEELGRTHEEIMALWDAATTAGDKLMG